MLDPFSGEVPRLILSPRLHSEFVKKGVTAAHSLRELPGFES